MYALSGSVLVVALPTLHRQGLLTMLSEVWPGLDVVVQTDPAAIPALLYQHSYAVVVLDCALFTDSVASFLRRLQAIRSAQPVLLLTSNRLPPDLRLFLAERSATHAWLPRHAAPATVAALFRQYVSAVADQPSPSPSAPRNLLTPTPFSRRELDVLRLVVNDHCNQEIADHLCVSVRTVESHRRALLQKAGVRTLVGLVVQAMRQGWVGVVLSTVCADAVLIG